MKKIIYVALLTFGMLVTGCSSKKEVSNLDGGEYLQKSRSQQMAEEQPSRRSWGQANSANPQAALVFAENNARAAFAQSLQTAVTNGVREAYNDWEKSKTDNTEPGVANDTEKEGNIMRQTLANVTISGLVVINSDTYKFKNGQYRGYVCVEYRGDVAKLASDIAKGFTKAIDEYGDDNISEEERIAIKLRSEEFRQSVLDELEKMGLR